MSGFNGTCYDGQRAFESKPDGRAYPDEYLIAQILLTYINQNKSHRARQVIVLKEPWDRSTNSRVFGNKQDGGKHNTMGFNPLIYKTIRDNSDKDILICVPFLDMGYHHPGIVFSTMEKKGIFIDPYGSEIRNRNIFFETALKKLRANGINIEVTTCQIEQQRRGQDFSNCGPILTASFIELIDNFIEGNKIDKWVPLTPRPNIATERMRQIYYNNQARGNIVNELMLAGPDLWLQFLNEQQVPEKQKQSILQQFNQLQDQYKGVEQRNDDFASLIASKQQKQIQDILFSPQRRYVSQFFNTHTALKQSHNMFYRCFIQSFWHNSSKQNNLLSILDHAINHKTVLGYRNGSFKACQRLGWLVEEDNSVILAEDAPEEVRQAYNQIC